MLSALFLLAATWTSLAPILTPRQEVAVASAQGRVYLIGGIGSGTVLSSVEEFDPASNRWRFVAPLPEPLHHAAAVSVNDSIYVIGGYRTLQFLPTDSVYRYEVASDRWSRVASLPSPRGAHAAAVVGDRIYVAGGVPTFNELVIYDPATDRWSAGAPMPTGREHHGAASASGRLYVASGRRSGNLDAFEMYDPASNVWTRLAAIPTARSGIAVAVAGNRLYVFGGEGNASTATGVFAENESFDVASGVWRREPAMPTPRHGIGAAVIGNTIYIPGGATLQGFGTSVAHESFLTLTPQRRRALTF